MKKNNFLYIMAYTFSEKLEIIMIILTAIVAITGIINAIVNLTPIVRSCSLLNKVSGTAQTIPVVSSSFRSGVFS